MNAELLGRVMEFLKQKRKNRIWRRATLGISLLVITATVYFLIYPALTASKEMNLNTISLRDPITTDSSIQVQESISSNQNSNSITTPGMMNIEPPVAQNMFGRFRMGNISFFSPLRGEISPLGEPYDLKNGNFIRGVYINGMLVQNDSEIILQPGSILNIQLEYEFAAGTLIPDDPNTIPQDERRNTFVYIMDKIKATEYKEGKIYQRINDGTNAGQTLECGIFKIGRDENEDPNTPEEHKTAEDKIFLIFDNDAITRNQTLRFNEGKVSFEALIAEVDIGDGGDIQVSLSQNITSTLRFSASIDVEKEAEIEDRNQGIILYKINIKAPMGTKEQITGVDNMIASHPAPNSKSLHAITDLTVKKKINGVWIPMDMIDIPDNATDFTFTLPKLKPGQEYELSYKAKLDEAINAQDELRTVNGVRVNTSNYDRNPPLPPLTDYDEAYANFSSKSLLKKSSFLHMVGSQAKVKWTLAVNSDRMDIDGWTLTDKLNGQPYNGTIKIYRNNETPENLIRYNGSENISLPFTFTRQTVANTRDRFIVTYYSPAPDPGESVNNVAILEKGDKKVEAHNTFTREMNSGVLSKWFEKLKIEKQGEDFMIRIFWKIAIEASNDAPIRAPWILYDRLSWLQLTHHFTAEELSDLDERVKQSAAAIGFQRNQIRVEGTRFKDGVYRGFKVIGDRDIPAGQKIDLTVASIDNLGTEGRGDTKHNINSGTNTYEFFARDYYGNRCILTQNGNPNWPPDEDYKTGSNLQYDTPIIKWDVDCGSVPERETTYNYYAREKVGNVFALNGNDLVRWEVWTTIPKTYNKDHSMIIRDYLPEGLTFDKNQLEMKWHGGSLGFFNFGNGNTAEINSGFHRIQAQYYPDQRMVEIRVTQAHVESLYNGSGNIVNRYPIRFVIGARIDDPENSLPSSLPGKEFTNSAHLYFKKTSNSQETEIGLMTHTKKIFKSGEKIHLHKRHGHTGGDQGGLQNNKIHYTLIVNPRGETLLPVGENPRLKLEDMFSYQTVLSSIVIATLDHNSVKVYRDTGNGENLGSASDVELTKKTSQTDPIDENSFRYDYSENQVINASQISVVNRTNFDLPDRQRLRIEYDYKIVQGNAGANFSATNSATLSGNAIQSGSSQTMIKAKISAGSAGVGGTGFRFKKIGVHEREAGEHQEFLLNGVKFQIHKYVKTENGKDIYVPLKESNGEIKIYTTANDGSFYFNEYDYNTAYRLVEVAAPPGYLKMKDLEFFANHTNTIQYPDKMPVGFRQKSGVRVCYTDMVQRVENEGNEADITIQKLWQNPQGNIINRGGGTIEVQLHRKVTHYNQNGIQIGEVQDEKIEPSIILNPPTWKIKKTGLPKKDKSNPLDEKRYRYYVKEVSTSNSGHYDVSYSTNNEQGIIDGTLTITNREKWQATLPETGGIGTKIHRMTGWLLILVSVVGIYRYRKNIQGGRG